LVAFYPAIVEVYQEMALKSFPAKAAFVAAAHLPGTSAQLPAGSMQKSGKRPLLPEAKAES
jgi:hypothetical protein